MRLPRYKVEVIQYRRPEVRRVVVVEASDEKDAMEQAIKKFHRERRKAPYADDIGHTQINYVERMK